MRERWAKLVGLILGACLLARIALLLFRADPLSRVQIPPIPRWAPTNAGPVAMVHPPGNISGTNLANPVTPSSQRTTNPVAVHPGTSVPLPPTSIGTNSPGATTNLSPARTAVVGSNAAPTSVAPVSMVAGVPSGMPPRPGAMPGPMPGRMPGSRIPLPPLVQARVDKIVQSELLGPVVRPMPMGLLGIAGPDVFLRTPNGQRVILREGETADGVKILRVGTNRVLIEHASENKELMIFSGSGGESLLPKPPAAKP